MSYQIIDFRRKILRHPTRKWSKQNDVSKIFLHTTASDNQDPNNTALYHITPSPTNHLSAKGCFAPGIMVFTTEGYKKIEEITTNDFVISPTSFQPRKVLATYQFPVDEDVFEVEWKLARGFSSPVLATEDHPFLVWKSPECNAPQKLLRCRGSSCLTKIYQEKRLTKRPVCNGADFTSKTIEEEIKWLPIKDIAEKDFSALFLGSENNWLPHHPLLAYLAGWYLAEGWKGQSGEIYLGLNSKTEYGVMEELKEIASLFGYSSSFRIREETHSIELRISGNIYNQVIKDFVVGDRSWNKQLTRFFLETPREYQKLFFLGYTKGDGHRPENLPRRITISTASSTLWHQLFILGARLGYIPSKHLGRGPRINIIRNREIFCKQEYCIGFTKDDTLCRGFLTENYLLVPFEKINKIPYCGFVYNLTIDQDEDYFIGNIPTHNCPSIAYHDFITKDGVVYHCNNYNESTWHTKGSNKNSVGICLAFRGQDGGMPVQEQWDALMEHLVELCINFKVFPRDVKGHREAPGFSFFSNGSVRYKKVCPGMGIDLDEMRNLLTLGLQQRLFDEQLYAEKIDGDFGPKSTEALMAYIPHSDTWPYETNL